MGIKRKKTPQINPIVSILPIYEGDFVNVGARVTLKDGDVYSADSWHGGGFWTKTKDGSVDTAIFARMNFIRGFQAWPSQLRKLEHLVDKYASLKTDESCIIFDAQDPPVSSYDASLNELSNEIMRAWSIAEMDWNRSVIAFLTWLVSPAIPGANWEPSNVGQP